MKYLKIFEHTDLWKQAEKVVVVADAHIGAPHALMTWVELQDLIEKCKREKTPLLLLGDIIDMFNCPEDEVDIWRKRQDWLEFEMTVNPYFLWIKGNHSALSTDIFYVKIGNLLACHGHTFKDSIEKIRKDQNRKSGKGEFSRWRYKWYRKIFKRGTKPSKYEESSKKMENITVKLLEESECNTLIHGHKHSWADELIFKDSYHVYRRINSPRGVKEYDKLFNIAQ